jgi:hypothetical protein
MTRILRILVSGLAVFVALALAVDGVIGVLQPALQPGAAEGVLRTFDEKGGVEETRLAVLDDGGTLWIQSGHHFRGWYHRLLRNLDCELVRDGEVRAYRAVPIDTPETEALVAGLLKRRAGAFRFTLIRTILLFADIKPVRLDPRGEAAATGEREGM